MFSLVDVNNFYASCERVFRPDLMGKAVIVLSSNDGCVIARSHEVKELGIPMGIPLFKIEHLVKRHKITVFSSNFTLYGDMSRRFSEVVGSFSEEIEIYSIDEVFFKVSHPQEDLDVFGEGIKKTVFQYLGLPVSLGFANTKTLAKVANFWAKKDSSYKGVCVLLSEREISQALEKLPLEEIWGIGKKLSLKLRALGINSAKDLSETDPKWMRKIHSVVLEKTVRELQGVSCFSLETSPASPKSIQVSRSFGRALSKMEEIQSPLSSFLEKGASKLRKQGVFAFGLYVYLGIKTQNSGRLSFASKALTFPEGVQDPRVMMDLVLKMLPAIFKEGSLYKKAGILLVDLGPRDAQLALFQKREFCKEPSSQKSEALFKAVDSLCQKHGKKTLRLASSLSSQWEPKKNNLSFSYTTKWTDLPLVFIK
ncbi:MAG: hypothetical protein B7Y25_06535 [Alphaproteobacteria bacterium 16-39-46]|nr:MAG: hypothetical protein B7Y25_06535 [Alphaproteobacteria bacterium 16-39-46]OZA42295.1 MAG: hypothetical protein B7X84_06610 [Alphaproteobacteria bacterium 17-39-52]HQS84036.1 Y-family DNA polymerase [Alphaproteobacteria bacterium]HQS93899.1 Y-family DNA polymerase [Alphaproteobacteria bacterium]